MRQGTNQLQSSRLNLSLIGKVAFLELSFADLQNELIDMSAANPFLDVVVKKPPPTATKKVGNSKIDLSFLERIKQEESFYEFMNSQIERSRFFPTTTSQKIAKEIAENLSELGYFEGDIALIAKNSGVTKFEAEKIRQRFAFLEPIGVGAKNYKEAFLFCLENEEDVDNEFYTEAKTVIRDFENVDKYLALPNYKDIMGFIKKVKLPPAIDFFEEERKITPDLKVTNAGTELIVKINSDYCPDLRLKKNDLKDPFSKSKLREAKELISLLSIRNKTITDVAFMIVQKQYEFFFGGDLKPLKMQDIADELGISQGTISRAVANKYLECDKGIFEIKSFFAQSLSADLSNAKVKSYLLSLIEYEDRKAPLSDLEILNTINKRFNIDLSRRSIAKYRAEYGILEKDERKRLYSIMM
ncbi:MAG: polymerase sigma54 factor [Pseudomonadota bacterium]